MFFTSVSDYSDRQNRSVQRILDQLDRCNARTDQHYSRVRKHERKPYRGTVSVFVPTPEQPQPPLNGNASFTAWAYSLSQGGTGFVTPNSIEETALIIGIHLPNGRTKWFPGDVVRKREIPNEGFFDYGIAFHAAHTENTTAALASTGSVP